jgi:4-diphosphocytidyl-2-C-methyl-D-erythritol kinase
VNELVARAPGKVNLSLFVGAPRADGLHPLVSVVQAVSLADELTMTPSDRDEVVCAGVDGENLAARALAAFRDATGWREPVRIEIVKRVPVAAGMGGGSADAAAVLRLAAHAAGGAPTDLLHRLAFALGADVPSQVAPGRVLMSGAGEHVERLPDAAPFGLVILPSEHTLGTPDVYAAYDRAGAARTPADLEREIAAALAGAPPPPVNDLQDAARTLCPPIDEALAAVSAAGARHAMVSGSGPTVFGLFDTPAAARAAARRLGDRAVAAEPVGAAFAEVRPA